MADQVLYMGVRGVTDLMMAPGLVNLDFADIRTVMAEMGKAMMGTGEAEGENRAIRAAEAAINNPLLEDTSMAGARGLLINITGGDDLTLFEVDQAANRIREEVDEEANIIFGSAIDETLSGRIRVSVVATGIDTPVAAEARPRLVAVGGGTMPAPQPIPMPAAVAAASGAPHAGPQTLHGSAMHAPAMHAPTMIPAPLRQPAVQMRAQHEPIAEGNTALDMQSPAAQTTAAAPHPTSQRTAAVHAHRQSTGLFTEARPTAAPPSLPQTAEAPRPSLFTTVTGAFRRRPAAPPAAEPVPPPRHDPVLHTEPRPAEAPRTATVRLASAGAGDEAVLDIPAFLRRQTS